VFIFVAQTEVFKQGEDAADHGESDENENCELVVAIEKSGNRARIQRTDSGHEKISDTAAQAESAQEFLFRILQTACGKQNWNQRERRGKQGGNHDSPEPPAVEALEQFLCAVFL